MAVQVEIGDVVLRPQRRLVRRVGLVDLHVAVVLPLGVKRRLDVLLIPADTGPATTVAKRREIPREGTV